MVSLPKTVDASSDTRRFAGAPCQADADVAAALAERLRQLSPEARSLDRPESPNATRSPTKCFQTHFAIDVSCAAALSCTRSSIGVPLEVMCRVESTMLTSGYQG